MPPINDNFANRISISGASGTYAGDTTDSTIETGEWKPGTNYRGTIWYEWTCPANGKYTFWMDPTTEFDTWIAIHPNTGALPTVAPIIFNDDGGGNDPNWYQARVNIIATSGTIYYIQCGKWQGGVAAISTGPFDLTWSEISGLAPAGDDFASPNVLANKVTSEFDLFYATAEDDDPWEWIQAANPGWWDSYSPISQRTMLHTVTPDVTGTVYIKIQANYNYDQEYGAVAVFVFDGTGVTTIADLDSGAVLASENYISSIDTLSFSGISGNTYWIWVTGYEGGYNPGPFYKIKARWPTVVVPSNDDWINATVLAMNTWETAETIENSTAEVGDPLADIISDGIYYPDPDNTTVWYKFTPPVGSDGMRIKFDNVSEEVYWVLFKL